MTDPVEIPRLSVAERDRRYALVRARMDAEGLDALILPANVSRWEQMMADSRYITTIGGFGTETLTIFPREGEVTAYVFNRSAFWKAGQDWVVDVRDGRNNWADNAIERLKEMAKPPRRVGISGLVGLIRAPDGIVPWTTVERLKIAFPDTEFVDATKLIQEIRAVKSIEEIALMRTSAGIIEKMIGAMVGAAAKAGARERDVYAAMVGTLLVNGGEQPSMLIFGTGPNVSHGQFVPTNRTLRRGDLIANEIEARYAGYSAQAVAPVSLGPASSAYADLLAVACEAFDAVREVMTPGTPLGRLMDVYTRTVESAGKGKYKWAHPMMHARGLGDESPALLGDDDLERFRRVELREGMTFILKPRARGADGLSAQIGDTVLVTPKGGERLGTRRLALEVIG